MKAAFSSDSAEINSTFRDLDDRNHTDDFSVEYLSLMEGELDGKGVHSPKEYGCNTELVSYEVFQDHRVLFRSLKFFVTVRHSWKQEGE